MAFLHGSCAGSSGVWYWWWGFDYSHWWSIFCLIHVLCCRWSGIAVLVLIKSSLACLMHCFWNDHKSCKGSWQRERDHMWSKVIASLRPASLSHFKLFSVVWSRDYIKENVRLLDLWVQGDFQLKINSDQVVWIAYESFKLHFLDSYMVD